MARSHEHGIAAAGNTSNPCLLVLEEKGYRLWLEPMEQGSLWCAEKNGIGFMGYSGAELLGVVTLWEAYGRSWNRQTPDVYGRLVEEME